MPHRHGPAQTLLQPGEMLGGFRVSEVIGVGGMAIVYSAEQVSLGRRVALKVLSSKLSNDAVFRERFRREGTHAATLEHPNIVPVYDSGEQDGHLYLAMRLIEGTNLAEVLVRGITADRTIDLLRPVASALDTAHAAGLIHRDVKPQNILINQHGHPYLADFGVAKGSNTDGLTVTGGFVGSVNYASPEQIKGLTLTPASDVYALTAVLYQCLTGEVPYPRETDAAIMHAQLTEPPPTLPGAAGANSDFHTVLARGMAKDSGSRYGHAGDLMTAAALAVARLPNPMRKAVPAFPAYGTGALHEETRVAAPLPASPPPAPSSSAPSASPSTSPPPPQDGEATALMQEEPAPRRGTRWRLLLGIAVAAALAAAAIVLATQGSGKREEQLTSGSSQHLALALPSGWRQGAAMLAGLPLQEPAILISQGGIQVNAGTVLNPKNVEGPAASAIAARYGRPAEMKLIHLPLGVARGYLWWDSKSGPVALYSISTSAGELALVCGNPSLTMLDRVVTACGKLARAVRVMGTKVRFPEASATAVPQTNPVPPPQSQTKKAKKLGRT
jgi:serine/threonine protein kinase